MPLYDSFIEMERKWSGPALAFFFLWIIATLSFGGVAPPFERVYPLCVLLVAMAVLFHQNGAQEGHEESNSKTVSAILFLSALFIGLMFFQLIPWSEPNLRLLAPFSADMTFGTLRELALLTPDSRFPITLAPLATGTALAQGMSTLLLFVSALFLFREKKIRVAFAYGLVCLGAAISFFGLVHRFSGSTHMYWLFEKGWTYFGPYINRNHAGALFAVCAAVAFGLLARERDPTNRTALSSALGILLLGLLFTGSRAAVVAALGAFLIRLLVWRDRQTSSRSGKRYAWTTMTLAVGVAFYWQASFFGRLIQSTHSSSPELRQQFWTDAISLGNQNPLFGIGFGSFAHFSHWFGITEYWVHPEHVENDYLELFASAGFMGGIMGLLLAAWVAVVLVRLLRNRSASLTKKTFALGLIALAFNSFFVFNAPLPAHQILFAILLAGIFSSHPSKKAFAALLILAIPLSVLPLRSKGTDFGKETNLPVSFVNQRAEELLSSETILQSNPIDAKALYLLSRRSAQLGDVHRAKVSYLLAQKLDPFLLAERIHAARALAAKAPEIGHDLLVSLADTSAPISSAQRGELAIDAAVVSAQQGNWSTFENEVQRGKELIPDDWRVSLLESLIHTPASPRIAESWIEAKRHKIPSSTWDSWLALLRLRPHPISPEEILSAVGPTRTDIGPFLHTLERLFPHTEPLQAILDLGLPSPRYQPNHAARDSATWITEKGAMVIPEKIEVHVRSVHQEIDTYLLPVEILAIPSQLSLHFTIAAERSKAPPKLVAQMDGRNHFLNAVLRQTSPSIYEFDVRNLGDIEWIKTSPSKKITALGFSPLEREGIYSPGPMKIFVNTSP